MTAEELDRVQEELGVVLPPAYRLIQSRPEFQTEAAGFAEFSGDADEVIGWNLELRQEGFARINWPESKIVIGEDGAGNYYFTDLEHDRLAVHLADCAATERQKRLMTSEAYETFADFLRFVQRLESELDVTGGDSGGADETESAPVQKPWWRRW